MISVILLLGDYDYEDTKTKLGGQVSSKKSTQYLMYKFRKAMSRLAGLYVPITQDFAC